MVSTSWVHANEMIVSGEKTKLVVTSTSANRRNKLGDAEIDIRVDGHALTESKSEKLLGVLAFERPFYKQVTLWYNGLGFSLGIRVEISSRQPQHDDSEESRYEKVTSASKLYTETPTRKKV